MATLGDLIIKIGADASALGSEFRSVMDKTDEMADHVADKLESIGDVGQRLAVLGGILSTAISLPLEEIARRSLDVAGTFEQTRIAFQSLMGSSAAAKDKLSELIKFAQDTPFEIPQVLDGARKLMALGFASKDIVPILRIVGDQAAAMGQGGVGMDRLLMNLGKIEAQGKITGHELRNLGEDDVPALASIARALGKSKEETQKLVSEGKIDAETAINAILQGMQLRTGGLMASQMDSFKAQLSNLKDQITTTFDAIGQTLLPIGKLLVEWAKDAMGAVRELAQWFAQLPAPIQGAAIAIAALAAAVGPALVFLGGLGMAIPPIGASLTVMASFFGLIEAGAAITAGAIAVMAGWALVIGAALVALTALGVWVYSNWAGIRAAVVQIFDGLYEAWQATIGVAVNWFTNIMGGSASDVTSVWNTFKTVFMSIWDTLATYIRAIWIGIKTEVIDPMMSALEKIPGFKKIEGAGSTFDKANADASERGEMSDIGKKLRVGADNKPFSLTDKYESDLEKHNAKLKEAVELLAKFKKGYEDGIVSEKDFKQAQANVDFIRNDVPKREPKSEGEAGKVDHNALDKIKGELASEEAAFARQKSEIEHSYQMAQPGASENVGQDSVEYLAQGQLAAAQKRKDALDKLAADELKAKLESIDKELAVDKEGQAGHERILAGKAVAEQKYQTDILANRQHFETLQKQINDRLTAEDLRGFNEDLKIQAEAAQKAEQTAKQHADAMASLAAQHFQRYQQHMEATASMQDKYDQHRVETGEITKSTYLKLKEKEIDELHRLETEGLDREQEQLDKAYWDAMDKARDADQVLKIDDDFSKRQGSLDGKRQQSDDSYKGKKKTVKNEQDDNTYNTVFKPFETSFASGLTGLIEGTKTFGQAWNGMVTGMLGSWTTSLSQMASKWVTHLAQKLALYLGHRMGLVAVHTTTNQATVSSDATTQAQSFAVTFAGHLKKIALKGVELAVHLATNIAKLASEIAYHLASWAISLAMHLKKVAMFAAQAAAGAFNAVVSIPIIGPVLAPVAAVAAFAGVMAFGSVSAESGAVLPNHNTVGFLHPQEMVLPKPISVGLQNLIASGGLSNAGSIMNQAQGGSMSSTALQMARNTAAADSGGDTHHNYNGPLHYHAANGESLTVDTFGKMFKTYVRQNNMKMA